MRVKRGARAVEAAALKTIERAQQSGPPRDEYNELQRALKRGRAAASRLGHTLTRWKRRAYAPNTAAAAFCNRPTSQAMTSMRRQEDRTPAPGVPAFRITVELPAAWQSYIANNVADVFDDLDPDDPWNRAAADREAAKLEKEGYAIVGPVVGAEAEFGRHEGTLGAITTYEAVNHDVLASDEAAGMWRFRPAGSETEYLILHRTEGVVWLPEHWRRKLADPACAIDECDIEWPDPSDDDPSHPPCADLGEMPGDWDPRDGTPPPQDLELWDDEAYERTARTLAARGWTLDQALDGSRLGWFHGQWGPLRAYVLTSRRDQEEDSGTRPWVQTDRRRL